MLRITLAVSSFIIVFSSYLSITNANPAAVTDIEPPAPFPFQKPIAGFAVGTVTNMLLGKLLHIEKGENPKCALSINNQLTSSRLVNPFLYLEHGGNSMPVPLKIKTNSSVETLFEAAGDTKDTSGLLFYLIENTDHYLLIFWKITGPKTPAMFMPNRFHISIIPVTKFFDSEVALKQNYIDNKAYSSQMKDASDFIIFAKTLQVPGRHAKDKLKITIRAQMTMNKQAAFLVEIMDNLSPVAVAAPQIYKRTGFEIPIAVGLLKLALDLSFKKIMKYIPSEQTGIISLENASKQKNLINPSWFIVAGETTSIVPWEIKASATGEISYAVPLLGTNIKESLKHTVYFLSYQIEGTDYHLVIGTWFPLKLEPTKKIFHREEGLFLLFVLENNYNYVNRLMKDVLRVVGEGLLIKNGNIEQLNQYLAVSAYKYIYDSIPPQGTSAAKPGVSAAKPGASAEKMKIQGVRATKLETYREWQYPIYTPALVGKPRTEFHIKIAAAIGVGKAAGLAVRVEIVPGKSPEAESFLNQNAKIYKEPPAEQIAAVPQSAGNSATLATGTSGTGTSGTGTTTTDTSGLGTGTLGTQTLDTGTL